MRFMHLSDGCVLVLRTGANQFMLAQMPCSQIRAGAGPRTKDFGMNGFG